MTDSTRWLTLPEAAVVAMRTERTIRNWIHDGILRPEAPGLLDRNLVLMAERTMRNRRGRPARATAHVVQVTPQTWVEVTACGKHAEAFKVGMITLVCQRCRLRPAVQPEMEDQE